MEAEFLAVVRVSELNNLCSGFKWYIAGATLGVTGALYAGYKGLHNLSLGHAVMSLGSACMLVSLYKIAK